MERWGDGDCDGVVALGDGEEVDEDSLECRARHQVLKEVLKILRVVRQADDGTIVERLGRVGGSSGEHVCEYSRPLHKEALEDTEGGIAGKEDEIAVLEPEVGMASECLRFLGCFGVGWFSGGENNK